MRGFVKRFSARQGDHSAHYPRIGHHAEERIQEFGCSEYAQGFLRTAGTTPSLDLPVEANLHRCLAELSQQQLIHSARDISDGGTAVALAEACFCHGIGMRANLSRTPDLPAEWDLFGETASQFIEADSLNYLSLEGLKQACDGVEANEYCTACYTGEYPTQWVDVAEILPATAVR